MALYALALVAGVIFGIVIVSVLSSYRESQGRQGYTEIPGVYLRTRTNNRK